MKNKMNLKVYVAVGAFFLTQQLMSATQYANGYTWTYQIKGDAAEIYGHYASGSGAPAITPEPTGSVSITIPSTLGGKPVTSIGDYAFYCCDGIWPVAIPSSVTRIGNRAFVYCSLRSVTIPSSVTSIGGSAFEGCGCLTSVAMHYGVRSIGDRAFRDCANLTSVTLPDSVKIIGHEAFKNCRSLMDIQIPSSVTSIGERAFDGCYRLATMVIPDSVTCIGESAFEGCNELTKLTIGRGLVHLGAGLSRFSD